MTRFTFTAVGDPVTLSRLSDTTTKIGATS